jgi:hypothetical protein
MKPVEKLPWWVAALLALLALGLVAGSMLVTLLLRGGARWSVVVFATPGGSHPTAILPATGVVAHGDQESDRNSGGTIGTDPK